MYHYIPTKKRMNEPKKEKIILQKYPASSNALFHWLACLFAALMTRSSGTRPGIQHLKPTWHGVFSFLIHWWILSQMVCSGEVLLRHWHWHCPCRLGSVIHFTHNGHKHNKNHQQSDSSPATHLPRSRKQKQRKKQILSFFSFLLLLQRKLSTVFEWMVRSARDSLVFIDT